MTLIEAIKTVLGDANRHLSVHDIRDEIVKRKVFEFDRNVYGSKQISILRLMVRRHANGIVFPSDPDGKKYKRLFQFHPDGGYSLIADSTQEPGQHDGVSFPSFFGESELRKRHHAHLMQVRAALKKCVQTMPPCSFESFSRDLLRTIGFARGCPKNQFWHALCC